MIISNIPIWIVDVTGSIIMIILSFLCLVTVDRLRKREPDNVIWVYLLSVCLGFSIFAVSRSAGHIIQRVLLLTGKKEIWRSISPYSGAANTLMFIIVGSITLFFERILGIYQNILSDKKALQTAHKDLLYLNQNLENTVLERTNELSLSEKKYRKIFEVSKDMILVTSEKGDIIDINPAGLEMLGYKNSGFEKSEKRFQDFFSSYREWNFINETIRKKSYTLNTEVDLIKNNGSKMRSLISGSLSTDETDSIVTIHYVVKDIEQKVLMEKNMARTEKLAFIGELSAGVAHEINNPMGIILGYTQLMIRNNKDKDDLEDLKTIEKHVKNCKTIVADLLNFSRGAKTEKIKCNMNELIDSVVKFFLQHSDYCDIEFSINTGVNIPDLYLDGEKIKQVLVNLIMNATFAVNKKGTIEVATEFIPSTNDVMVKISDNGIGIEEKYLTKIFDPFFTTKPTGQGTGLGLSVSYGIIREHSGDITVASKPGKGSVFKILLPAVSAGYLLH